jgi:hypothetical protein
MNDYMRILKIIFVCSLSLGLFLQVFPVQSLELAQDPDPAVWQTSSKGLSVNANEEKRTAGLGLMVRAGAWPALSTQGGVEDTGQNAINGPTGIELGEIRIPGTTAVFSNERLDWSHNELTYNLGSGGQLKVMTSRLSSAVLVQSPSSVVQILTGDLPRNSFDGSKVTALDAGPVFPKYVSYQSGSGVQVQPLSGANLSLQLNQNWLLIWYGNNSYSTDTKMRHKGSSTPPLEVWRSPFQALPAIWVSCLYMGGIT